MANVEKSHSQTETGEIGGVSTMLHTARMRAGIELGDVAERLRIRFAYLEAIEEGRFSDLPGPTYALGFVRAYADFLELDGREIVRQFKEEGQGLSRRQELVFPEPIQEGRFPGTQLVIAALVLAGLVYGGWYYWQHRRNHTMAEVAPVPPNLAGLIHPKEAAREKPAATTSTSAKPEPEPATEAASTQSASAPTTSTSTPSTPSTPAASSPPTSAAMAPTSAPSSNTAATAPTAASETSTANGGSSASTAPTQPEDQDTVPQAPTPLATTTSNAPAGSASEATPSASAPETSSAPSAAPESSTPESSNAESSKTESASSGASAPSMPVAEIPKPEPPPTRTSSNSAAPGAIAPTSAKTISANSESAPAAKTEAAKATKAETAKAQATKAQATKAETAQPASAAKAPASEAQLAARPSEPHIFSAVEGGSQVTLIARQDSWLQVRDKTGQVIWTRILRAGESYKVPNEPGLTLATGNAGALEVTVDGKSVPALGAVGAVRRNISLDPAKLVAGTAAGQ